MLEVSEFFSGLVVFDRFRGVLLLEVGNYLIFFLGSSAELINLGEFGSSEFSGVRLLNSVSIAIKKLADRGWFF